MKVSYLVIGRFFIGALLCVSGLEKLIQPWQNFAYIIEAYAVFPQGLESFVAQTVPWVELLLGTFLILGLWLKPVIFLCQGLFSVFAVMVAQALVRKLPLEECGCFGQMIFVPPLGTFLMDVVILVVLTLMLRNLESVSRWSLDRSLR